ncbi:MAG: hypothetical protein NVSMB9_18070 [Isosphaeraceae bacterium]
MPWPRVLADLIVLFHALFVAFVVLGMAVILLGLACRWEWVRNFWFRVLHLAAIGVVVLETLTGMACPLTTWEGALRRQAGQRTYPGEFIGYWAHRLIFIDAQPWVFTTLYVLFGASVLLAFLVGPPRLPGRAPRSPSA